MRAIDYSCRKRLNLLNTGGFVHGAFLQNKAKKHEFLDYNEILGGKL